MATGQLPHSAGLLEVSQGCELRKRERLRR
ncbi:hypothetical protein SAMN04490192_1576 [Pseudomonas lundensis]|nr:hypothetical protein SAMN04490192_1576 [Pseudomonas lundensis]